MNRIYQGRVSSVQIPNLDPATRKETPWVPLPDWEDALWRHHELFQDALNYYFAAFAAMVSPEDPTALGQYRRLISDVLWSLYDRRKGSWTSPFAQACIALGLKGDASFMEFEATLFCNAASEGKSAANRQLGIAAVLSPAITSLTDADLGKADNKDDALTQKLAGKGRDFFPKLKQLCTPHGESGTTPADEVAQQGLAAKAVAQRIAQLSTSTLALDEAYLFKTSSERGRIITGKMAKAELLKRSAAASADSAYAEAAQNDLTAWLATLSTEFSLCQPGGKTPADFNAALLFAHLPQSSAWRAIFLNAVKSRLKREIVDARSDPVQDLRGIEDQPLFPFFTNLIAVRNGFAAWPDFEKQAFIEVFTKVGRFLIEQQRRNSLVPALNQKIDAFEARIATETRLQSLDHLLQSLGGERVDDAGQPLPYGIRARSLKCWDELRKTWLVLVRKSPLPSIEEFLDAKKRLQKKRQIKFGNSTLFHALAESQHHNLWNNNGDDILDDWAKYTEAQDELKHLSEAPSFTPAHPKYSPRFFRWSENQNKTHLSWPGEGPFAVEVDSFDFSSQPMRRSQWLLHYRAPRLLRDGLRRKDDVRIETVVENGQKKKRPIPLCDWLPPVLRARSDLFAGAKQTIDGTSVRLMPASKDNVQLVLEANLDNSVWLRTRGKPSESYYRNKREEVLEQIKWPQSASAQAPAWFSKGRTTCLSIDLGLRTPASFAIVEAIDTKRHGKPNSFHRPIGGTIYSNWVGAVLGKGVMRLSGEDRSVYRLPTKGEMKKDPSLDPARLYLLEELSGARGRKPSPDDTEKAAALFLKLDFTIIEGKRFARIDQESPDWRITSSFPEQNDRLLRAFARMRGHLFILNRWSEQLSNDKDAKRAREELAQRRAGDLLPELLPDSTSQDLLVAVQALSREFLARLCEALPILADRVLPTRGKSWRWILERFNWHRMVLSEDVTRKRIEAAGQRGISIARINQVQYLRRAAQSLNHLCRHEPGKRYKAPKRDVIPDPFAEAGIELEKLKTQRAKQLAHEIFARAIGVELADPPFDKKKRRELESLHGVYRPIKNRQPVDFIAMERLASYRMSEQRSRRENRQLADWGHREVVKVLEELCELIGLPILYVEPAYSSRFAAFDGCPGFRAEEVTGGLLDSAWLRQKALVDDDYSKFIADLKLTPAGRSLLKPRNGGPVFVPLSGNDGRISHADINAAINVGFRALAHQRDKGHWPIEWAKKSKRVKKKDGVAAPTETNAKYLIDHFSVLGGANVDEVACKAVEITGFKERDLWDHVNDELSWQRCHKINERRLANWRDDNDQIPM